MRRWLIVGIVLWGTAVFTTHVFAHAELVSATPAPGSSVPALTDIELLFSEPVGTESEIELLQDFVVAAALQPVIDGNDATVLTAAVPPLPDGVYTVQWRITSTDGHPISGSYSLGIDSTLSPANNLRSPSTWWTAGILLLGFGMVVLIVRRWQRPATTKLR